MLSWEDEKMLAPTELFFRFSVRTILHGDTYGIHSIGFADIHAGRISSMSYCNVLKGGNQHVERADSTR